MANDNLEERFERWLENNRLTKVTGEIRQMLYEQFCDYQKKKAEQTENKNLDDDEE